MATAVTIHSLILSGYLYSAPSRNLLRCALSSATVKEKCLKKLAERRHVVLSRAYFNVQLITICAVVKLKCAVVKGNLCSCKMCSCWHKIKNFINNIVVDKLLFKNISVTCFRL